MNKTETRAEAACLSNSRVGSYGSSTKKLVSGSDPVWLPGGQKIAFSYGSDVYMINIDGSGRTKLAFGIQPIWSPDQSKIAFSTGNYGGIISVINADGSNLKKLTDGYNPAWVP